MSKIQRTDRPAPDREPLSTAAEDTQPSTSRADQGETPPVEPAPETPKFAAARIRAEKRRPGSRQRLRAALFALLPLVLIAGGYWYVTGGRVMSTDDAYVEADKVGVSTDVSGLVQDVDVSDNQHVTAGQVLYRLDPRQFQIALDNAKANLAQTALNIEAMKKDYARMLSDTDSQQAQVGLDRINFERDTALLKSNAVSKAIYDQANFTLQADQGKLASLKQQAQEQLARLGGSADLPVTQHPQYLQAKAQVDEAQRQLDHTVVRAAFAGIVTNVPSIAPGKYLAASTTAFYLVATDHVWIDANPKETELTHVRAGQPVTVTVDTYPGLEWHGTVESISPAAAQEFQLLPAQNTSGNWVKVVQRIPMRVRVDTNSAAGGETGSAAGGKDRPPLRAGMSVEVAVDTGHARGLPHFVTAVMGWLHGSV
ncbi:MAG: HlyD family secretion protein [Proteobacteria bacterium]|nr:HlyD family secretion protein [Pseudomonadota bacterium]